MSVHCPQEYTIPMGKRQHRGISSGSTLLKENVQDNVESFFDMYLWGTHKCKGKKKVKGTPELEQNMCNHISSHSYTLIKV